MNPTQLLRHMATGSQGSCRQIGLRVRSDEKNIGRYMRVLAADGLVEKCGAVRLPGSQRDAAVWRISEKGRAAVAAMPSVEVTPGMANGGGRRR